MALILVTLQCMAPGLARAYDATCVERGLEYSVVTGRCEATERKPTLTPKETIRLWREAAGHNDAALAKLDLAGCDRPGQKHREPSLGPIKSLEVRFVDGTIRRIIPTDVNCEGEPSDREHEITVCEITHFENKTGNAEEASRSIRELASAGEGPGCKLARGRRRSPAR